MANTLPLPLHGIFCRFLPGLKRIVLPGGISTSSFVRGFRPIPRLRGFTWKTPKPLSSILRPSVRASRSDSIAAFTARSACVFVIFVSLATMSTRSAFIIWEAYYVSHIFKSQLIVKQQLSGYCWNPNCGGDDFPSSMVPYLDSYLETLSRMAFPSLFACWGDTIIRASNLAICVFGRSAKKSIQNSSGVWTTCAIVEYFPCKVASSACTCISIRFSSIIPPVGSNRQDAKAPSKSEVNSNLSCF